MLSTRITAKNDRQLQKRQEGILKENKYYSKINA